MSNPLLLTVENAVMKTFRTMIWGVTWCLVFVTIIAASPARAGTLDQENSDRKWLGGLTRNEYRGCAFVDVASSGFMPQRAPEPWVCAEAKQEFNGDRDRCITFVTFTYNRKHRGTDVPTNVKGLGMFGCAMLVDNIPSRKPGKQPSTHLGRSIFPRRCKRVEHHRCRLRTASIVFMH